MNKKTITVQIGTGDAAVDLVIEHTSLESFARAVCKAMTAEREVAAVEAQ